MTPEDPAFLLLSHPLTGITVTFLATLVATFMVRLKPKHRPFWEDAKDKPGQALLGATLGTSLAAAFPRLVYDLPRATCEGGVCRSAGGGPRVLEGTGFGAFIQQFVRSAVLDVPAGLLGLALGVGIAAVLRRPGSPDPTADTTT